MRVHLDVLGWLYIITGTFGILTAASLAVLAFGTLAALAALAGHAGDLPPAVWLMLIAAALFGAGGVLMAVTGRDLVRRGSFGRHSALVLALPTLLFVPFGTALSVYTFWTLLNDEARREFGRPLRATI